MAELAVGKKAPDFVLPRDGGGVVKLSDMVGKPVVLYFYPADDTPGCTAEAIEFSGLKPEFAKLGATVIGVSPDSAKSHDKFKTRHGLGVDLASDENLTAIQSYGVWAEKSMFGRKYMGVVRTTFLIGSDGRIARVWKKVKVPGHASQVLEAAKAL
jgi:thioredoxin-dependent peroxiredoxin